MSALGTRVASIVWRRHDGSGRDAMRLFQVGDGWLLAGAATWSDTSGSNRLDYAVSVDARWRTRRCSVDGLVGTRQIALRIERSDADEWTLDGRTIDVVAGSVDVDLAFTPATNLLPIRRLALAIGESASVRAAWLRVPELDLRPLEQTYARAAENDYDYESGGGTFRRRLRVERMGLVLDYPGRWIAESVQPGGSEIDG